MWELIREYGARDFFDRDIDTLIWHYHRSIVSLALEELSSEVSIEYFLVS